MCHKSNLPKKNHTQLIFISIQFLLQSMRTQTNLMVIHNLFSCLSCQLSFLQCSSYSFKYQRRGVSTQLRDNSTSEPHYHYHTVCFYIQCLLLNSENFTNPPSFKQMRICCRKVLIHSL